MSQMRTALAILLLVGALVVPSARVAACSCAMATPAEAASRSDAVFAGRVLAERDVAGRDGGFGGGSTLYTFAVDGVAKGAVGERVEVLAGGDGNMCGMPFSREDRWLVFATLEEGTLTSGLCSGNVVLAEGDPVPLELAAPVATAEAPDAQLPVPVIVVLVSAALVLVASWLAFRRGRLS